MRSALCAMAISVLASASACAPGPGGSDGTPWDFRLPSNVPLPVVPADNPLTVEKFELGRRLFYDPRLSVNGTISCSSCHRQELAFTDGRAVSVGATGDRTPRNAMSLVGAGYLPTLTWVNPVLDSLERQALVPLFGESPIEHGLSGRESVTLATLEGDGVYRALFSRAFPRDARPITIVNITRALASFQRALMSADSPFDRYVRGEPGAMSASAERGLELFNSERLECYHCHAGPTFTTAFRSARTQTAPRSFENNGLYNLDAQGSYPPGNAGLSEFTGDPRDHGRMRVPTLRNVAVTGPYMHDGSLRTLDDVLQHYMRGGTLHPDGPFAGDGRLNPNKNPLLRGFTLTESERQDLLAFLNALTDETFLRDPRFSDPFAAESRDASAPTDASAGR
jgi:cytochrome c peroxidase